MKKQNIDTTKLMKKIIRFAIDNDMDFTTKEWELIKKIWMEK